MNDTFERALAILREGGVIAFPTETVYGIGADALDEAAVQKVIDLKGRGPGHPLPVVVDGAETALRVVHDWSEPLERLAERFWPGPLTIAAPSSRGLPPNVTSGFATVALRCPDHAMTRSLVSDFGRPIVGPSANRSGRLAPTAAEQVHEALENETILVLDGGPCKGGIESTVVEPFEQPSGDWAVRIHRPGAVGIPEIERATGLSCVTAQDSPAQSRNATEAPVQLIEEKALPDAIAALTPERPVVVICGMNGTAPEAPPTPHALIRLSGAPEHVSSALYRTLREADATRPAAILIERPEEEGPLWDVIRDRLERVAKGSD